MADAEAERDRAIEAAMRRHPTGRNRLTRAERSAWERLSADLEASMTDSEERR